MSEQELFINRLHDTYHNNLQQIDNLVRWLYDLTQTNQIIFLYKYRQNDSTQLMYCLNEIYIFETRL